MHGHTRNAERGQGMLEYCLVAVVVGLIVLFAMSRLGGADSRRYDCSNKTLETAKISDGQSRVRPGCDEQVAASRPARTT